MKLVFCCGGRNYNNRELIFSILADEYAKSPIHLLLAGFAKGADGWAHQWTRMNAYPIQDCTYHAHWDNFGKKAGYIRNKEMAKAIKWYEALGLEIVCYIFPGGKGTKMMTELLEQYKLPYIKITDPLWTEDEI